MTLPLQGGGRGSGGAGGTGGGTTFDLATASGITLSNGNLTATVLNPPSFNGARSASYKTTGKYYFEITVGTINGTQNAIGIINQTETYTNAMNSVTNCSETIGNNGNIWSNGAGSGFTLGSWTAGANIGVAVDLAARKCWMRKNGGLWNGNGTADPVANVNGATIGTGSFSPFVGFNNGQTPVDNMTANFGATAFTYAAPSGFANWT